MIDSKMKPNDVVRVFQIKDMGFIAGPKFPKLNVSAELLAEIRDQVISIAV